MLNKNLESWTESRKIGHAGSIRLVDVMGDDAAIVQAARVSYGAGTKSTSEDKALIRYLIKNKHWSPVEMCEIKLHIKVPVHVARQLVRHRTACLNEVSTRYSEVQDCFELATRDTLRLQSKNNKQGSAGCLKDLPETDIVYYQDDMLTPQEASIFLADEYNYAIEKSFETYQHLIDAGVAREQARNVLPLATYTEMYWKCDLRNLFNFLSLRLDAHAQQEIRELAEAIADIVKDWVPYAWEAYEEEILNSYTLSSKELKLIKYLIDETKMNTETRKELFEKFGISSQTERIKFWNTFCKE